MANLKEPRAKKDVQEVLGHQMDKLIYLGYASMRNNQNL
jgi:hypothetical protein